MATTDTVSTTNLLTHFMFRYFLLQRLKEVKGVRKPTLSLEELFILEVIKTFENVTSKELCKFLHILPSGMTTITKKLLSENLIEETNSGDNREKPWKITSIGLSKLELSSKNLTDFPEKLLSGLNQVEFTEMKRLLEKMFANQHVMLSDLFQTSPILSLF